MTNDSSVSFCHEREQGHGRPVTQQATDQVDDFWALFFAESAFMDTEYLGAVCICCEPDHHHLTLTVPGNACITCERARRACAGLSPRLPLQAG